MSPSNPGRDKLLQRWPAADQLANADPKEIRTLAHNAKHGWPDRFTAHVRAVLATPRLAVRPELARAKAGTIALTAAQLLLLHQQRRVWQRRMSQILLADPHQDPSGNAFPGGEIYLSMPGLGDLLAARIAGEIGEAFDQFATPNALQCYAGAAPVTRRSGRSEYTFARRLAYNHQLGNAVHQWAFCSLQRSTWARQFYDMKITTGKGHHAALRALSNRWLEILWHCLRKGVTYDEAIHIANRQHLKLAA